METAKNGVLEPKSSTLFSIGNISQSYDLHKKFKRKAVKGVTYEATVGKLINPISTLNKI